MFLGYETIPLPKEVLERIADPKMKAGAKIAEIRQARGKKPKDILARISEKIRKGIARSKEAIDEAAYSDIEKGKKPPLPCYLFDISRELMIDPIYIIDGRDWERASAGLPDNEKMKLCRRRKGWTQEDCALAFEKAGLDFGAKSSTTTKTGWVSKCEQGKIIPTFKEAEAIGKVFCDKSLFEEVTKKVVVFLDGVAHTKIRCFFAKHPEVSGMTPSEIERDYNIPAVSIRTFLRKHPTAVDTYGIKFREEKKPPGKRLKVTAEEAAAKPEPKRPRGAAKAKGPEGKGLRLPGDKRTSGLPQLFAEHQEQIIGMTIEQIAVLLDKPASTIRNFLWHNSSYVEFYGVEKKEKGKKPKITIEEAAEKAAEKAEEAEAMPAKKKAAKKAKRTRIVETTGERVRRIRLKATAVGLEVDHAIFEAVQIFECLRSPKHRGLVEALDIEDAISELRSVCDGLEEELEPEKRSDIKLVWMEIRKRWIETRNLLRRLKLLVPTGLCDWDNPQIRQKATEITKESNTDTYWKNDIVRWVNQNISLVSKDSVCWKTKASVTFSLLKGTDFNRANLTIAMLRSIGIPARYKIMSLKGEADKDMPPTRKVETTEHVVVEALICIEEIWDEVLEETHRKYKWITLEPIKDEKVIESYVVDNIDEFARKKAREYKRKPRTRAGGQGGARGRANPSQELKALMAISQSA